MANAHSLVQQQYYGARKARHGGGPQEELPHRRLVQGKTRMANVELLPKPCATERELDRCNRRTVRKPIVGNECKLGEYQGEQYPRTNPVSTTLYFHSYSNHPTSAFTRAVYRVAVQRLVGSFPLHIARYPTEYGVWVFSFGIVYCPEFHCLVGHRAADV